MSEELAKRVTTLEHQMHELLQALVQTKTYRVGDGLGYFDKMSYHECFLCGQDDRYFAPLQHADDCIVGKMEKEQTNE